MCFLLRTPDTETAASIHTQLNLPSKPEFDVHVRVRLVRRRSHMNDVVPGCQNVFLGSKTVFDFLNSSGEYFAEFLVVRHRTDQGEYTTMITNLPPDEFSLRKIVQLYRERWRIETAFGQLKGALAMESFHSTRPALIEQEVWAKMTAFNYVSAMRRTAQSAAKHRDRKRRAEGMVMMHKYDVDFTFVCKTALDHINPASYRYEEKPEDLIDTMSRRRHPTQRKRKNPARGSNKKRTPIPVTHRCAI